MTISTLLCFVEKKRIRVVREHESIILPSSAVTWSKDKRWPYLEIQHWNANQESLYENDYPKKVGEIQCPHGGACANLFPVY